MLAVVDWELSTLGHPLADFSYHVMLWRVERGRDPRACAASTWPALGIPTEAQYVAAYCRRTGRAAIEPRVWEFCMAYNLFRIACIRQGIMRRVVEGTAASRHAREAGSGPARPPSSPGGRSRSISEAEHPRAARRARHSSIYMPARGRQSAAAAKPLIGKPTGRAAALQRGSAFSMLRAPF